MKKKVVWIICSVFCFVIVSTLINVKKVKAESIDIGVSPGRLRIYSLAPGETYQQEFIISRSNPVEANEALVEFDAPDLEGWLDITPSNSITLPIGEQRVSFIIDVHVPEDVAVGVYNGFIRVKLKSTSESGQVKLTPAVRIDVEINVIEKEAQPQEQITIDSVLSSFDETTQKIIFGFGGGILAGGIFVVIVLLLNKGVFPKR